MYVSTRLAPTVLVLRFMISVQLILFPLLMQGNYMFFISNLDLYMITCFHLGQYVKSKHVPRSILIGDPQVDTLQVTAEI